MKRPDINNLIPKNNFQGLRKQHNKDSYIKAIDTYCDHLKSQNKELIEENKGVKIQAQALQDAVNKLIDENERLKESKFREAIKNRKLIDKSKKQLK